MIDVELTKDETAILRNGIRADFWNVVSKVLRAYVSYYENEILDNDELSQKVEITTRDFYRLRHALLKDLIGIPNRWQAQPEEAKTMKDFDPFAQSVKDLKWLKK